MKKFSGIIKQNVEESKKLFNEITIVQLSNIISVARKKGFADEEIAAILDLSVEELDEVVDLAKDLGGLVSI